MAISIGTPMPSLAGATSWVNFPAESDDLFGHPTLVQFWAISCPVCKMNFAAVRQWQETYGPRGLRLVSIHMPRAEADMNINAVAQAVQEQGLTEPCAIDNDHTLGDLFQTGGLWPCYFLFDRAAKLRSHGAGPAGLRLMEGALKRMLGQEAA